MNLATEPWDTSTSIFPIIPAISEGRDRRNVTRSLTTGPAGSRRPLIKMGVKPGQHVGLCAPNSADWLAFYFGVIKAGGLARSHTPPS